MVMEDADAYSGAFNDEFDDDPANAASGMVEDQLKVDPTDADSGGLEDEFETGFEVRLIDWCLRG